MITGVHVLVLGLLVYVRSAPPRKETVWLKDVTTLLETDKRTVGDPDLPSHLTFHIRRGSDDLTLNLKRNYEIDPNADIYILQKMKVGRSILKKATNFKREDVAYYQNREDGAYMTVRCVRRSNQPCERVINGNMNIENSSYDLQPAETIDSYGHLMEIPDLIGRRYLLLEQDNIQLETLIENKDIENVIATNVAEDKENHYNSADSTLSSRNVAKLRDRDETDKTRQLKQDYYIKVAVLIDPGIWQLYSDMHTTVNPQRRNEEVQESIKEAFSHIINGVDLRYKSIDDPRISISIILHSFIFYKNEASFPHKYSQVFMVNGTKYIEAYEYIYDLAMWANSTHACLPTSFDHAMLFTRYKIYDQDIRNLIRGKSFLDYVCHACWRVSLIYVSHYAQAVRTATHELGHSLGADHDGEGNATACKPEDLFIMTPTSKRPSNARPYIKNMWMFSNCSVELFQERLKNKDCLKTRGPVFNIQEWTKYMTKQAGDVFTPEKQCYFIYGPGSKFIGDMSEEICHLLRCKNPKTGKYMMGYINAANGTKCGANKWCIDGRCVTKS